MRRLLTAATAVAALAAAAPAPLAEPECGAGYCAMRMTAPELLTAAEQLVLNKQYDEAKPLVAALEKAPELAMERQFLEGYIAAETGDLPTATAKFRRVLALRPDMTRARLELARSLMMQGKDKAADYHFSLAEDDDSLPPEIARTIYAARGLIRERRRRDSHEKHKILIYNNVLDRRADNSAQSTPNFTPSRQAVPKYRQADMRDPCYARERGCLQCDRRKDRRLSTNTTVARPTLAASMSPEAMSW